jgi:hypothetical protein
MNFNTIDFRSIDLGYSLDKLKLEIKELEDARLQIKLDRNLRRSSVLDSYNFSSWSELYLDASELRGGQKKPPETKEIPDTTDDTLIIY